MIPTPIDPKASQYQAFKHQLEMHQIPTGLAHDVAYILAYDDLPKIGRSPESQSFVNAAYELLFQGSRRQSDVA